MGECVIVYGKSGAGKTRSLLNFGEDEITIFNVEGKRFPVRKKFKYVIAPKRIGTVSDVKKYIDKIKKALDTMPTKTAVIDDAGYLMTQIFMTGHRGLKGNEVYELYNDIGDSFFSLVQHIKRNLPEDVIVYVIMHEDENDKGDVKLKTIGRILDNQVCIEGLVTVCIRAMSEDGKHFFRTVTNGDDITKTPEGMFDAEEIDNDLKLVDTSIRDYYLM